MSDPIQLSPKLDLPAASELATMLKSNSDPEVILDLSEVKHLGAICLQVMISAANTLQKEDRNFSLINASDRVIDQLRVMGMSTETIARGRI